VSDEAILFFQDGGLSIAWILTWQRVEKQNNQKGAELVLLYWH
jgi:hypothetical protein